MPKLSLRHSRWQSMASASADSMARRELIVESSLRSPILACMYARVSTSSQKWPTCVSKVSAPQNCSTPSAMRWRCVSMRLHTALCALKSALWCSWLQYCTALHREHLRRGAEV